MKIKRIFLFLLSGVFALAACAKVSDDDPQKNGERGDFSCFFVEFSDDFDLGSPEKRLSYDKSGKITAKIKIKALDYNKEFMNDYNGFASIELQYGKVSSIARVYIKNGLIKEKIEGENDAEANEDSSKTGVDLDENGFFTVEMKQTLNKDRIIVHEIEKREGANVFTKTGKVGVSQEFYPPAATISAIQGNIVDAKGKPSLFNHRNLTIKGGNMVVVAVIEGGFYLAEVGVKDYSSIYLYTHSTPYVDDADVGYTLPTGALIEEVNGSVFDFFGFTEMSFPTFVPKYKEENGEKTIQVDLSLIPQPVDITSVLDNDNEMEKREANIVTVKNVTVDWFNKNDSGFIEYSQFPLKTQGGLNIMAQTLYTAPTFNAVAEIEKETKRRFNFTGILKQHTSARPSTWIIVPRDKNDVECIDCEE